MAREFMGVADKDVQPIVEKAGRTLPRPRPSHAEKVESIKQKTADKIAEVQAKKVEASKATPQRRRSKLHWSQRKAQCTSA